MIKAMRAIGVLAVVASTAMIGAQVATAASWRVATLPSLPSSRLTAVSCPSTTSCMAVGRGTTGMVALQSGPSGWVSEHTINLRDGAHPVGLACPSVSECLMVGDHGSLNGQIGFSELWNGTAWSLRSLPADFTNGTPELFSISCPTAAFCLAGGDSPSQGMGSLDTAATVEWTGSAWTRQTPQPPSPARASGDGAENELTGVSCASSNACMAVGVSTDVNPEDHCANCANQAEIFDGRTWAYRPTAHDGATSVDCPVANLCVAVGGSTAQVWDGRTWLASTVAGASLRSVSCPTAASCVAVGNAGDRILVERWNGRAWSAQTAPSPAGSRASAVSCASAQSCVFAGSYSAAGRTAPLIETYS